MSPTVVLVHGAWHGAWTWDKVVPGLSAAGVKCLALDLPGHGDDTSPMGDLHSDGARVGDVLDQISGEVILVGHSYGGAVISEAGIHPAVQHLVYLAAFALDVGESCVSMASDVEPGLISYEGRPNLGAGFVMESDGMIRLDSAGAKECLYNDCDDEDVEWAVAQLGLQPLITLQQEATDAGWRSRNSTYVVCQHDMAVHPDLQRIMAGRCQSVVEWPTDHSPFLGQPDLVIDLLVDLARR